MAEALLVWAWAVITVMIEAQAAQDMARRIPPPKEPTKPCCNYITKDVVCIDGGDYEEGAQGGSQGQGHGHQDEEG